MTSTPCVFVLGIHTPVNACSNLAKFIPSLFHCTSLNTTPKSCPTPHPYSPQTTFFHYNIILRFNIFLVQPTSLDQPAFLSLFTHGGRYVHFSITSHSCPPHSHCHHYSSRPYVCHHCKCCQSSHTSLFIIQSYFHITDHLHTFKLC